ncbi:MAG TPA: hypothetical protein VFA11_04455 [Acidimicrobiales bacterium]|nr:hypothetical protein [Acidimicrobiales bacterium]
MAVRPTKPWMALDPANVARLGGQLGVYEVADGEGRVALIAYAGGRSPFGLRGELESQLAQRGAGWQFRVEVTMAYLTRWRELLMVHVADHGGPPPGNIDDGAVLGRMSPA